MHERRDTKQTQKACYGQLTVRREEVVWRGNGNVAVETGTCCSAKPEKSSEERTVEWR